MSQIPPTMDPAIQFLDSDASAKQFDTVTLARSTEKALKIIMPWCHLENSSNLAVAKEMHEQAIVYAQAIDSSVGAANLGFAMAEDALSLVELIPQTTPQERIEYLEGVNDITKKGCAKAMEAKNGFMNVRRTIESLLSRMRAEDDEAKIEHSEVSNGFLNVIRRPFMEAKSELSRGIHDLEEFSNMLSQFVSWWNLMAMETKTQLGRGEVVMQSLKVLKYDKLRMLSIEMRWKDHRRRYADYVNEIGVVQDRYPKLFSEAKLPALAPAPAPAPTPTPTALLPTYTQVLSLEPVGEKEDLMQSEKTKTPSQPESANSNSAIVIISEDLSTDSYMSASLSSVQILEKNKCLLILQFQCHPSSHRRFTSMRIKWKFRTIRGASRSPTLVDVAPKQSIGAKNEENHQRKLGVKIPAQFNVAGVTVGPEVNTQWKMQKTLSRAMFFMGSIRGHNRDSAEWSVEENGSAMSGIPTHFCVAAVVDYGGVFMMELDIVAKQCGVKSWWSSRNHAKGELAVHVDPLHSEFQEYKPAHSWQQWFPLITGEVAGGYVVFPQGAEARGS